MFSILQIGDGTSCTHQFTPWDSYQLHSPNLNLSELRDALLFIWNLPAVFIRESIIKSRRRFHQEHVHCNEPDPYN